jgi:ribosomal protein S18 acetylase RimI-like enzyme
MEILMRKAEIEDRPRLLEIAKSHPDTNSFLIPWYSGEDVIKNGHIWVAEIDNRVVGFYSARFGKMVDHISLYYIVVSPAYRRHGIGQIMLNHLKSRALESTKHNQIKAKVNRENEAAWNFFMKNGFISGDSHVMLSTRRND